MRGRIRRNTARLAAIVTMTAATALGGHTVATALPAATGGSWSVVATGNGYDAVWHGGAPLPIMDAPIEVRLDGKLLAYARERAGGVTAHLTTRVADPARLELWRAGQRVDRTAGPSRAAVPDTSAPDTTSNATRPATVDPGVRGPYATRRLQYTVAPLRWHEFPEPIEVQAEVTVPVGAAGARPFVLVLHGRHGTCYAPGDAELVTGDWPCPAGLRSIPSFRGYRTTADLLASQGAVVVSIAANGINGQDYAAADGGAAARSALVRHHLALWAAWAAHGGDPWGGALRGRVAMDQVVLIGHSRGGEGVARAAIDSTAKDPWRVQGLLTIGPTAFGQQIPSYVQTAVILPYCDGDVVDLQGQAYVDGARDLFGDDTSLRSALLVMGANHNYFNSQWTPGLSEAPGFDDWLFSGNPNDPRCGVTSPHRLAPAAQQQVGATYAAALVRLAVGHDPAMRQLLDGEAQAASIGTATVRVSALGGGRTRLFEEGRIGTAMASGALDAHRCYGYRASVAVPLCAEGGAIWARAPHWIAPYGAMDRPAPVALDARWAGDGTLTVGFGGARDLRTTARVDLRVVVDPASAPASFTVELVDASGHHVSIPVDRTQLVGLPGRDPLGKYWAQTLRASLTRAGLAAAFDLAHVTALRLHTTGPAHLDLLDAMAVPKSLAPVATTFAPRVSVGTVEVTEGDAPGQTVEVPLYVHGAVRPGTRVWLGVDTVGHGRWVDLQPGVARLTVPVFVAGDDYPSGDVLWAVTVYSGHGVVTDEYIGGVLVHDDDQWPPITVEPVAASAVEGGELRWTVSIPAAVSYPVQFFAAFVAPAAGAEIDSDDVPAATWFQWTFSDPPSPPVHPSDAFATTGAFIEPGATETTISFPLLADGVTEGTEHVALDLYLPNAFDPMRVTGTVTDS